MIEQGDWRHRAACLGEDPELFFPIGSAQNPLVKMQIEDAKAICRRCTVAKKCLDFALDHKEHGVWGGKDEDERKEMIAEERRLRGGKTRVKDNPVSDFV